MIGACIEVDIGDWVLDCTISDRQSQFAYGPAPQAEPHFLACGVYFAAPFNGLNEPEHAGDHNKENRLFFIP